MKTKSIELSRVFISFLLQDGIVLPKLDEFEELAEIESARQELGGSVFIKLNWSSPKDAKWMTGSLKCTSLDDMILLLKSSDFITHDLLKLVEMEATQKVYLSLRKWKSIRPSMEFRCFVRQDQLIGISQRYCGECYPFLAEKKPSVRREIEAFHQTLMKQSSVFPLSSFVFDVYFQENDRLILLDFNVFDEVTDSLLFSWDELVSEQRENKNNVEFRIVDAQQVAASDLSQYRVPIDFDTHHLYTTGGMVQFLQQVQRDQQTSSSSSDESESCC